MTAVDIDHLRTWIGKEIVEEDVITARHAQLMAATVDHQYSEIEDGKPLPALWHWIYFLQGLPSKDLGRDGHPARGGFLPPVPLPNRMWAGGLLTFHKPIIIGSSVMRRSRISSVDLKDGTSGPLIFVKVRHELTSNGDALVTEDHDIVYTSGTAAGQRSETKVVSPAADLGEHVWTYAPTSTTLFRYSALTFNGHRIHYDADYCREIEGYPNLVIHGPLNATLLANHAESKGAKLQTFKYRGVQPAFLGAELTLHTVAGERAMSLQMAKSATSLVMTAQATFR